MVVLLTFCGISIVAAPFYIPTNTCYFLKSTTFGGGKKKKKKKRPNRKAGK